MADCSPGPWVARVEDEETCHDGTSRMEAIAAALDAFCGDVEAGWHDPGDYTVHVWSGCTFLHRDPETPAPGAWHEDHTWKVDTATVEPVALATVYERSNGEIAWRLADD